MPDAALERAARLCMSLGTDGLRGELTLMRAARAVRRARWRRRGGRRAPEARRRAGVATSSAPQPARRRRLLGARRARGGRAVRRLIEASGRWQRAPMRGLRCASSRRRRRWPAASSCGRPPARCAICGWPTCARRCRRRCRFATCRCMSMPTACSVASTWRRTLQLGRPVAQRGLLAESDGGVILLAMAERAHPATVAMIAAALDAGEVVLARDGIESRNPARFGVVALDESSGDDAPCSDVLLDRLAFVVDLHDVSLREAPSLLLRQRSKNATDDRSAMRPRPPASASTATATSATRCSKRCAPPRSPSACARCAPRCSRRGSRA